MNTGFFQVAKHRIFTRIPCAFRLFSRIRGKISPRNAACPFTFSSPPSPSFFLSLFSIFPSSFQRIVRAREYFTAGINQRNSGKQLIILLLTISRSLLRLPCAPPLLFSFNRKIGRGPPTIFFDFVCYFWFHIVSDCLLECSFTWSARLRLCLSAAMFLHATPAL